MSVLGFQSVSDWKRRLGLVLECQQVCSGWVNASAWSSVGSGVGLLGLGSCAGFGVSLGSGVAC